MGKTKEPVITVLDIAVEVANGDMFISELLEDVEFLESVNNGLKTLMDKNIWPEISIAEKRQKIIQKIEDIKNLENERLIDEW